MRRKPSMFSKNYRKELKQRRIRRVVLLVGVILIVGGSVIALDKGRFLIKNYFAKDATDDVLDIDNEKTKNEEQSEAEEEASNKAAEEVVENIEAKLISDKTVIVELKDDNNKKVIVNMQCPEGVTAQISPSGEKGLILDDSTQDIYIVDTSKEVKTITNQQYISTDKQVFTKEGVLQYTPNYKWVEGASFINDSSVAYSSQLPWINEGGLRYLWIVNIDDNSHKGYFNIKGNTFTFTGTGTEGVSIETDGKSMIVNDKGQIVSN